MRNGGTSSARGIITDAAAVAAPIAVTLALLPLSIGTSRDYVFIYIAVVAVLGVAAGLVPALIAAGASFLLVDWFFVQPAAHAVDHRPDRRRQPARVLRRGRSGRRARVAPAAAPSSAPRRSSRQLRRANSDLERLNREQAEAAAVAVRLRAHRAAGARAGGDRPVARRAARQRVARAAHTARHDPHRHVAACSTTRPAQPSAARSRASSGRPNVSPASCPTCSTWRGSRGTHCVSTSSRWTFATPSRPRPSGSRAPRPRARW